MMQIRQGVHTMGTATLIIPKALRKDRAVLVRTVIYILRRILVLAQDHLHLWAQEALH